MTLLDIIMIPLTRLNGTPFTLNIFLIEEIEALPDTTITLINGKKIIVRETESNIQQQVLTYYQNIGLFQAHTCQTKTE